MENLEVGKPDIKEAETEVETPVAESLSVPKLGADFSAMEDEEKAEIFGDDLPGLLRDKNGVIFDAEIHDTMPDGSPKYRIAKGESTGVFAKRRGQRKQGNRKPKAESKTAPIVEDTIEGRQVVSFSPEVMSALFTTGYFQIMSVAVGAEFSEPFKHTFVDEESGQSVVFDEANMIQQSIKGIMVKRGVKSASPETMLILSILSGIGARATIPDSQVQRRIFKPFLSWKSKLKLWRENRKKKKAEKLNADDKD